MVIEGEYAVCTRSWSYDDPDLCHGDCDSGDSSAKISRQEAERFIDDVLAKGKEVKTFSSINSFKSDAHYSEGAFEHIEEQNYAGKVEISIAIKEDGKVDYRFLPSVINIPTVRLGKGRDYL